MSAGVLQQFTKAAPTNAHLLLHGPRKVHGAVRMPARTAHARAELVSMPESPSACRPTQQ